MMPLISTMDPELSETEIHDMERKGSVLGKMKNCIQRDEVRRQTIRAQIIIILKKR